MTGLLYALIASGALVSIAGAAIAIAVVQARRSGRDEVIAEIKEKEAEHAEKQGTIIAEHREPADVSRRLRDGNF